MTVKSGGGSGQACAACKYQRRKCSADCQLAPYFPADNPKQFQYAHRLFGVKNIQKILNKLPNDHLKTAAMNTIIIESNARAHNPVHGCYLAVKCLTHHINCVQSELEVVERYLAYFRQQNHLKQQQVSSGSPSSHLHLTVKQQNESSSSGGSNNNGSSSCQILPLFNDEIGVGSGGGEITGVGNDMNLFFWQQQNLQQQQQQQQIGYLNDVDGNVNCSSSNPYFDNPFMLTNLNKVESFQGVDEISPYFGTIGVDDDRQNDYILESKDAFDSIGQESSLREAMQSGTIDDGPRKYELKTAAAGFSLTNTF